MPCGLFYKTTTLLMQTLEAQFPNGAKIFSISLLHALDHRFIFSVC